MADGIPELKEALGAIIFAASHPMTVAQMKQVLAQAADVSNGEGQAFAGAREADIQQALAQLQDDVGKLKPGFELADTAEGYRFQSAPSCGAWVRHLRDDQRPPRLSRPALETLAIIAYRQPAVRSEIEAVRGVAVDHILHSLLEMQLIRIVGRSELPGRPMLYGTTGAFLEHFGLRNLKELPGIEQLSRMELAKRGQPAPKANAPEAAPVSAASESDVDAEEPPGEAAPQADCDGGTAGAQP